MFCTDDERENCQCEKMGCYGCYYFDDSNAWNKIKELKKEIRNLKIERDYFKKMYLETNNFFLNDWRTK